MLDYLQYAIHYPQLSIFWCLCRYPGSRRIQISFSPPQIFIESERRMNLIEDEDPRVSFERGDTGDPGGINGYVPRPESNALYRISISLWICCFSVLFVLISREFCPIGQRSNSCAIVERWRRKAAKSEVARFEKRLSDRIVQVFHQQIGELWFAVTTIEFMNVIFAVKIPVNFAEQCQNSRKVVSQEAKLGLRLPVNILGVFWAGFEVAEAHLRLKRSRNLYTGGSENQAKQRR